MRKSLRWLVPGAAAAAAAALVLAFLNPSGSSARLTASTASQGERAACPANPQPGYVTCFTIINTAVKAHAAVGPAAPAGYGPRDLRSAYKLSGNGPRRTIAIVDAYNDPNAQGDLRTYRQTYGLPACTTANHCFRKVNQKGRSKPLPRSDTGWAAEISLDLDMVSAICPSCKILLVEAKSSRISDMGAAENTAVRMGARYITNSWGGPEAKGVASRYNHFFNHPGKAITFSSGDSGYGVHYPAASRYVTAVGGTSLTRAGNRRGWSERAWAGAGSGCSRYSGRPGWQPRKNGCRTHRTVADVSAVADPNTGVAVRDTFHEGGWLVAGGTSVSAPIIAAVYARSATPRKNTYPARYPYRHRSKLWDVVGGSNGTCRFTYLCTAVRGYDGPTGLGTPISSAGFKY